MNMRSPSTSMRTAHTASTVSLPLSPWEDPVETVVDGVGDMPLGESTIVTDDALGAFPSTTVATTSHASILS